LSLINFSNLGTVYAKKSLLSTATLFSGFAVVLLLNFFLTPRFHAYGATASSVGGHLVIVTLGYILSARFYRVRYACAKDAFVFLFFLTLSLAAVHLPLAASVWPNILIQLLLLSVVLFLLLVFLYPGEYQAIRAHLGALN